MLVYIALGSNLAQPLERVKEAKKRISALELVELRQSSSYYQSPPLGFEKQPLYINAVLLVETDLTAEVLLDRLQAIEDQMGRVRQAEKWASRIIDIDIVLYGDRVIQTDRLTVPHYDMRHRAFVLMPMLEIDPDCVVPSGETVQQLLDQLDHNGVDNIVLWADQ